ncbi:MAG: phosphoribosyltransferase family protein [Microthrixaceae bacterium]
MTVHHDTFPARVGSQVRDVPLLAVAPDVAIALLITSDHGVDFMARAGAELAAVLEPLRPEVVATNATLGLPVAIEVTRALGLDDYLLLHKTPKIHLEDAFTEPLRSITTDGRQMLRLDRARQQLVAGRRVVLVDDVVSTGNTIAAGCRLLRSAGAELVGIGALLVEGTAWHATLGDDVSRVRSLGTLPMFRPEGGGWVERDT